jgi:hypothetical protein
MVSVREDHVDINFWFSLSSLPQSVSTPSDVLNRHDKEYGGEGRALARTKPRGVRIARPFYERTQHHASPPVARDPAGISTRSIPTKKPARQPGDHLDRRSYYW